LVMPTTFTNAPRTVERHQQTTSDDHVIWLITSESLSLVAVLLRNIKPVHPKA